MCVLSALVADMGSTALNGELELFGRVVQLFLHGRQALGRPGDEDHESKLAAQDGHSAIFDIAALLEDQAGEPVNDSRVVFADGAEDQSVSHGGDPKPWRRPCHDKEEATGDPGIDEEVFRVSDYDQDVNH